MYGNLNPSTNAWPFTPEHVGTGDAAWAVVDNRDVAHAVVVEKDLTFQKAVDKAATLNRNHFRGS